MGIHHAFGQRNAPTVLNALFNTLQFWDGRAPTLEKQIEGPILNPIEMGNKSFDDVVAKVKAIPEYQQSFQTVFNGAVTMDDIEKAIAAYERTQIAFDTPFDRFMAGDQNAISASAKRGWSLFNGKGRCMTCHGWNPTQPMFSDNRFHNIGVSAHKSDFVPLARKALVLISQGGGGAAATRPTRDPDRHERARPLPGHQAAARYRRLPHHGLAQSAGHAALLPRRFAGRRCGTCSIITTKAACRIRISMAASFRSD